MSVIDIAQSCYTVAKLIYEVKQNLDDNNESVKRLIDRCQVFEGPLTNSELHSKMSRLALEYLKSVFDEILEFVTAYTKRYGEEKGAWMKRAGHFLKKVYFRKEDAETMGELNIKLNQSSEDLNLIQGIDFEERRRQDLEDSKKTMQAIMESLASHSGINNHTVTEILDEVKRNNEEFIQTLLAKSNYPKLTQNELSDYNASIANVINLYHEKIVLKLQGIEEKIDDSTQLLLQALSGKTRDEVLRSMLISHTDINLKENIVLGEGGFGKVLLGKYGGRDVAVKKLSISRQNHTSSELLDSIFNEIVIMKSLNYPGILHLFGYYQDLQYAYVILELAHYGSLVEIVSDKTHFPQIPLVIQLIWMRDIISAIAFMHSKSFKHRDIKPDNFLVCHDFQLKLCDFGLSKQHATGQSLQVQSVVGTHHYMAPEVMMKRGALLASDMYSFAISVCVIMSRALKHSDSAEKMVDSAINTISSSPEAGVDSVSVQTVKGRLRSLLLSCLHEAAEVRPTAEQAKYEVASLLRVFCPDEDTYLHSSDAVRAMKDTADRLARVKLHWKDQVTKTGNVSCEGTTSSTTTHELSIQKSLAELSDIESHLLLADLFGVSSDAVKEMLGSFCSYTGDDLVVVSGRQDLEDMGLKGFPELKYKKVLGKMEEMKKSGVDITKLKSKFSESIKSTINNDPQQNSTALTHIDTLFKETAVGNEVSCQELRRLAAEHQPYTSVVTDERNLALAFMMVVYARGYCSQQPDLNKARAIASDVVPWLITWSEPLAVESPLRMYAPYCLAALREVGLPLPSSYRVNSFTLYIRSAEQGYDAAQYILGKAYCEGVGVPPDNNKALEWFTKAAQQGHPHAQYKLGMLYKKGEIVDKDNNAALSWLLKAADRGQYAAQYTLAHCYKSGDIVSKDSGKALELFVKAAEQGYDNAQYSLGMCFKNGEGVDQDHVRAAEWFARAAAQGHMNAQYSLGVSYNNGHGVLKDNAKALECFRKAAEQGHVNALSSVERLQKLLDK